VNAALRSARRLGIGVVVAVAALTLAGCAAGQHAPTAEEVPVVDGVSADVGAIALRAVTVAPPDNGSYPSGGDAHLQLVMVNDGQSPDNLVGVQTAKANQVLFFGNEAAAPVSSVSGTQSTTPSDTATPSAPTSTPTPTPTESSAASGTLDSIELPPGRAVSIGYAPDLPVIQLRGLTSALYPAESFPITFQFERAGTVTFTVAVHLTPGPSSTPTLNISPTAPD
jgi:copper(I)-binding protein